MFWTHVVPPHKAGTGRGGAEGTSKLLREKRALYGPEGVAWDRCLWLQSFEKCEQEQDRDEGGGEEKTTPHRRKTGSRGLVILTGVC